MQAQIRTKLQSNLQNGRKAFAVLLDPDKVELESFPFMLAESVRYGVDFFFVGGSLITRYASDEIIAAIHKHTHIPAILFPGNSLHIEPSADAILLLSLISGRNPELLIGQHVIAAPLLKKSKLEILPTGYMLIESGRATTVSYISNTTPIPHDKPGVAACTAMAGELLGLQIMYLDAGSGAQKPVSAEMIAAVRQAVDTPIIVGGGINSVEKAQSALEAGADVVVVGNGIEKNPDLLPEIAQAVRSFNEKIIA
ncbi:geranylgeranylglyceryl/heptaprenylglyceryl phosphate synthase [Runella sp. CRIBMP]|uniref:Geranylgeranylglyceryl phosphate synthase n=2 Tax=Runella TaxID=105 RepID=A0A369I5U5_9BACT|nr:MULTISPECIES: geranylgeranylglyceryl/heptaprenylglyceryl phosphate synthase [Runella]MCP1383270.1 geranylgeranylglyceryl/heptaprenylglyceryl phosphate synthase [Runella salmonicolor]NBB20113.1 geranylgeranylglyceryl/heptaprenylglyceryl phosphate synthase [Runella sp. CRIBMP]RDB02883.1 geranylgeranylglyceryl/heptaprenylglyceryl phosphate synthase [Runella aurantiaca]